MYCLVFISCHYVPLLLHNGDHVNVSCTHTLRYTCFVYVLMKCLVALIEYILKICTLDVRATNTKHIDAHRLTLYENLGNIYQSSKI